MLVYLHHHPHQSLFAYDHVEFEQNKLTSHTKTCQITPGSDNFVYFSVSIVGRTCPGMGRQPEWSGRSHDWSRQGGHQDHALQWGLPRRGHPGGHGHQCAHCAGIPRGYCWEAVRKSNMTIIRTIYYERSGRIDQCLGWTKYPCRMISSYGMNERIRKHCVILVCTMIHE